MSMTCTITTPEQLVYEGEAQMVVVPGSDGELGILPAHAPLMALLGVGELRLAAPDGSKQSYFVSGGFVKVQDKKVTVLATEAEAGADIDAGEAASELSKLQADLPSTGITVEERQEWNDKISAAKIRVAISKK